MIADSLSQSTPFLIAVLPSTITMAGAYMWLGALYCFPRRMKAPITTPQILDASKGTLSPFRKHTYVLAGYHDSIAMVLSCLASLLQGAQEASGSDMNMPVNFVNTSSVLAPLASSTLGGKELSRSTNHKRAFSRVSALSPIRDGL